METRHKLKIAITTLSILTALMLVSAISTVSYGQLGLLDPETEPDPDLDTGSGYYPPPYSYGECLTVFSKEACDFRFNR